jgi:hypothetical protein
MTRVKQVTAAVTNAPRKRNLHDSSAGSGKVAGGVRRIWWKVSLEVLADRPPVHVGTRARHFRILWA